MSAETKEKLAASLRARWASGTRKPNPEFSDEHRARLSDGVRNSEVARAARVKRVRDEKGRYI